MNDEYLDKLEAMCAATQPSPWTSYVEGRDHTSGSNFIMTGTGATRGEDLEISGATVADQDFIAEARNAIPKLILEIRELRKRLAG